MTEEETIAKHSTPSLRRNVLPRHAKKLNMEFDAQYNWMTKADRDEFLDKLYPEDIPPKKEPPHAGSADVRIPKAPAGSPGAAEKAEAETDSQTQGA